MYEEGQIFEIENSGYKAGNNPLFGKYHKTFNFAPVPYGSPARQAFKARIASELDVNYLLFGEVKVEVILYLSEQKRFETPELADLDNYAKLICDSIKGSEGLLIDDSQIQSLNISWIDTTEDPYFEINILGAPDEFVMKPLKLYEMPNNLFYPISSKTWTTEGINDTKQSLKPILEAIEKMTKNSHKFRHELRQKGFELSRAFFLSQGISPILPGFHKNRVIDGGFELVLKEQWKRL
ncbi:MULTISPECIES: RusA family crossover junction endodeoxyribonuclease [Paenibacillus]|uniref:Endodeoxyribonuclease RusA n=1 Tax=Paenibacillus sophorae TaxID=1333845 RepID=A0A1H8N6N0_9BACL|nr:MULTISPECIES: RusA family crossover junction endodeoxyribonuclease [Paenibacillus]QWU14755.1 RusA family crossover junction endodeoxyribonuclease [Paenibacillus sophorae]SEO25331.1 Endodeoxyribonuclease RusA [Paenibacillus sophorae]